MTIQKKKYEESLKSTPGPVKNADIPNIRIDIDGIVAYARQKGVQPFYLSDSEKEQFIIRS